MQRAADHRNTAVIGCSRLEVGRTAERVINREDAPEVVIVGAGLGGLSAAIHLRLAGHRVTIYEANDKVGGRANVIERDGFRFDTGPSLLNYPWVFEQLFEAAGRSFHDYVKLIPVDPSVTFQWEDGTRLQLSGNVSRLVAECERVAPGSGVGLISFLEDAGAKYRVAFEKLISRNADNPLKWFGALRPGEAARLGLWRSLDGELRRFFKSRYIREAFGSYGMYLGGSPFDLPGLFTILAYGELAYGLWLPQGGIYGLVEGIERLAMELGIVIQANRPVSRIITEKGRVHGVELADGEIHRVGLVVSNVDLPTTESELLDHKVDAAKQRAKAARLKMTPGVITYYWGIEGKVDGIGHHTIFLPEDYRGAFDDLFERRRIPQHLPFYVSVPSETDASLAPPGDTAMFVLVPTPLLSELPNIDWPATIEEVRERVLARLRRHGVEIESRRIVIEEVLTPRDWSHRFGLYDGSAFGQAHTLFQVGPFRSRNYSREVEGLYYVGASTTPGTGMPMVVLSGKLTAERIRQRVGGGRH